MTEMAVDKKELYQYLIRLGDNALILGQRLSEWCGHGPVLEQDIALTNIALDLIGQTRSWYQYAAQVEGKGRTEDEIAHFRDAPEFLNVLLVEQPNEDWAHTIVRQFLFDAFNFYLHEELCHSNDEQVAAIANKSIKEIAYHLRYSSEWMIRLGDGTEESHQKMQDALDDLWMFAGEQVEEDALDKSMAEQGIGASLPKIKSLYFNKVHEILDKATLQKPEGEWFQEGGKQGRHSEHLGFILTELQYMQRTYPGQEW
ncbi:MAG: 1,2-phenylacetyl-CoA epoxidase subunit PaaC [Saprospiraceae bacterium]